MYAVERLKLLIKALTPHSSSSLASLKWKQKGKKKKKISWCLKSENELTVPMLIYLRTNNSMM